MVYFVVVVGKIYSESYSMKITRGEYYHFLGCDAMQSGRNLHIRWRKVLPRLHLQKCNVQTRMQVRVSLEVRRKNSIEVDH
jgi:hypothetical protein